MPNDNSVTWQTTGKKLGQQMDPLPSIDVTEYLRSFSMDDGKAPYGSALDAPLAVSMIKQLWDRVGQIPPEDFLRRLLEGSFAITFDKNILLKTISQPKCEGVRFYLCLKNEDTSEPLLSLATVGVDENGKDLLYQYDAAVAAQGIQAIPTRSLVAEYGHPPGKLKPMTDDLDPFVLFKYSKEV